MSQQPENNHTQDSCPSDNGLNPHDPVERMINSLMKAAYSQAINLVDKSNERGGFFSIPYEKANVEAMGYMRVFNQLTGNYLKIRKEKAQETVVVRDTITEENTENSPNE